jgi:hypothetical protein
MGIVTASWRPNDEDHRADMAVGRLVAWKFTPWRVIEMFEVKRRETDPEWVTKRTGLVLRPAGAEQWKTAGDRDVHGSSLYRQPFPVLREHYGLCVRCNELLPCREQELEWTVARESRRMACYDQPGVCPACGEGVTYRQEREVMPNTVVPGGPTVTFHAGRKGCRYALERYRQDGGIVLTPLSFENLI